MSDSTKGRADGCVNNVDVTVRKGRIGVRRGGTIGHSGSVCVKKGKKDISKNDVLTFWS